MRRLAQSIFALALSICALPAFADGEVRVKALNHPAWLVRNYDSFPLQAGTLLLSNDLIRTGEGGRVQVHLTDNNTINLGESSRLLIGSLPAAGDSPGQFSLQALRGVFRLTAGTPANDEPGQQIGLRVGDIEAVLDRGDIWGRADLKQDAVCLVDGELSIGDVDMDEALSCYVQPKGQAPLPVDLVDRQQHQLWIAEIELKTSSGIAAEGGQWQLVLISLTDASRAGRILESFRERGFAVEDKTVVRQGRTLHRLLLPGFISIEAALSARKRVEQNLGVSETWVWKAN